MFFSRILPAAQSREKAIAALRANLASLGVISLLMFVFVPLGRAADGETASLDWPTYRRDNHRSGRYPRDLELPLIPLWTHQPDHPPQEAWPGTARSDFWRKRTTPEKPRVTYDKAYHVVAAGDRVLYGTSADDQVVCLRLRTGEVLWRFFAEGPVRLAPTITGDRVLFGSDDGYVYCVSLSDGKLIWKQSAMDSPAERLPGNGRIISKFPIRAGVLVRDGTVYFAAGLFPSQGVWYCSLALDDGRR
ncbi:MAG: PQQ-like beta-propeller repeat protein, partial [Planctomycetales bacterium]